MNFSPAADFTLLYRQRLPANFYWRDILATFLYFAAMRGLIFPAT